MWTRSKKAKLPYGSCDLSVSKRRNIQIIPATLFCLIIAFLKTDGSLFASLILACKTFYSYRKLMSRLFRFSIKVHFLNTISLFDCINGLAPKHVLVHQKVPRLFPIDMINIHNFKDLTLANVYVQSLKHMTELRSLKLKFSIVDELPPNLLEMKFHNYSQLRPHALLKVLKYNAIDQELCALFPIRIPEMEFNMPNLEYCKMVYMNTIMFDYAPNLSKCMTLKVLHFEQYESYDDILLQMLRTCVNLPNLRELSVAKVANLQMMMNLQHLRILKCTYGTFSSLDCLSHLTNLNDLDISYNRNLTDVSGLSHLMNLEMLNLDQCVRVDEIDAISCLQRLQFLDLSVCCNIKRCEFLTMLHALQFVQVWANDFMTTDFYKTLRKEKPFLFQPSSFHFPCPEFE